MGHSGRRANPLQGTVTQNGNANLEMPVSHVFGLGEENIAPRGITPDAQGRLHPQREEEGIKSPIPEV